MLPLLSQSKVGPLSVNNSSYTTHSKHSGRRTQVPIHTLTSTVSSPGDHLEGDYPCIGSSIAAPGEGSVPPTRRRADVMTGSIGHRRNCGDSSSDLSSGTIPGYSSSFYFPGMTLSPSSGITGRSRMSGVSSTGNRRVRISGGRYRRMEGGIMNSWYVLLVSSLLLLCVMSGCSVGALETATGPGGSSTGGGGNSGGGNTPGGAIPPATTMTNINAAMTTASPAPPPGGEAMRSSINTPMTSNDHVRTGGGEAGGSLNRSPGDAGAGPGTSPASSPSPAGGALRRSTSAAESGTLEGGMDNTYSPGGGGEGVRLGPMPGCATQALPVRYTEWTDSPRGKSVTVRWTYGNETCNSLKTCFAVADPAPMEPQLIPVQIQPGVQVRFTVDAGTDSNFTIRPFWVPESNFLSCDVTGGIPIITQPTGHEFIVQPEYLKLGPNYFIVETDPIFKCEYGLRVNVTVMTDRCKGPGEPLKCWGRGRCVASPAQPFFECACCHGYTGSHCEDLDACVSSPCDNGGVCQDEANDPTGTKYSCICPRGTYGTTCSQKVDNMCNTLPCENNGTCSGNSTHYRCECPHGYSGWHCEININECASNPCLHGVCVDKFNGFQCFCIPGHGGTYCEKEYDECQSNPCKSGGFCIDKEDGWECHCGRGYTGDDCSIKVDLCDPSPCSNATDCVDYGNTFTCTCNPGFTGLHCEININECGSSPCQNGGRCYDQVAGYKCMCTPGHTGLHCEHTIQALLPRLPVGSMYRLSHHHSHLHNLSIIAGTLAGALLIALSVLAGCYCRLYGTYHLFNFRQFKYKRQAEDKPQVDVSDNRPNVNAILEATSSGYHDNNLNAPLVHSLKARKI